MKRLNSGASGSLSFQRFQKLLHMVAREAVDRRERVGKFVEP